MGLDRGRVFSTDPTLSRASPLLLQDLLIRAIASSIACSDDRGISGATLERLALKRLLRDVEAGLIDVVMVYKIDRLGRSLTDFAKLVDVFERHNVTFDKGVWRAKAQGRLNTYSPHQARYTRTDPAFKRPRT